MDTKTKFNITNKILKQMNIILYLNGIILIILSLIFISMIIGLFFNVNTVYYIYASYIHILLLFIVVLLHFYWKYLRKKIDNILKK